MSGEGFVVQGPDLILALAVYNLHVFAHGME